MSDVSKTNNSRLSGNRTDPPPCRSCGQPAGPLLSILNPRTGDAERMFRCTACGILNWMEPGR
ncbi:hypothetical protein ACVILH_006520 [Bradyrhizobium sp. USDA 4353]